MDTNQNLEEPEETEVGVPAPGTAAEKLMGTLRELSKPGEDAGGLQLTVATVAMGMEAQLGPEIGQWQETGELDEFMLGLTRFLAYHRSDTARQLVVVELPRHQNLPAGTKLHYLDQALQAAENPESPL